MALGILDLGFEQLMGEQLGVCLCAEHLHRDTFQEAGGQTTAVFYVCTQGTRVRSPSLGVSYIPASQLWSQPAYNARGLWGFGLALPSGVGGG